MSSERDAVSRWATRCAIGSCLVSVGCASGRRIVGDAEGGRVLKVRRTPAGLGVGIGAKLGDPEVFSFVPPSSARRIQAIGDVAHSLHSPGASA